MRERSRRKGAYDCLDLEAMTSATKRPSTPARFVRIIVLIALLLCAKRADAQTLTIQGDRFAIDGTPTFLLFMSYFGAMGAPNVAADFHFLHAAGFNGVRIWPNLDTGPQLM